MFERAPSVLVQGQVMTREERLISQDQHGALRLLSLSRPPLNALNRQVLSALSAALAKAGSDPSVMAVVLAANGPQFSAGMDSRALRRVADGQIQSMVRRLTR